MNRLPQRRRAQILGMMVEGVPIRSISRMTGASKNTVVKLLADLGKACKEYQDRTLRNLCCQRIKCDEIWSFCYAKEKNVPEELKNIFDYGDVWTWTAICSDTKLVPSWLVGKRDAVDAHEFITDLANRLSHRVQLTTDGHRADIQATEDVFGAEIDYAMLVKLYGKPPGGEEKRYSPAESCGAVKTKIQGSPEECHISTSYAERQNLTMRMQMRRFTRLPNAFSKKIQNHEHAIAIYFMHYNFARIHKSLSVTPAMMAGVTDHVWELEEIINLLEAN